MRLSYDTVIIGAGASGLMLASLLPKTSKVAIFDTNSKIGAKIAISGGGRCNFTNKNLKIERYCANSAFIKSVFKRYDNRWLLNWAKEHNLELVCKRRGQYFCANRAKSLIDIFQKEIDKFSLHLNEQVLSVSKDSSFIIETTKGRYRAKNLVVASGGLSYPKLGASDIGFRVAKSFNHSIVTPLPALVGFTLQREQFFMKELSGISLDIELRVEKKIFKDKLLFAHRGVSGPAILNGSLWWKKGKITIDFLPEFNLKSLRGAKSISTLLPMPKRASKAFLEHLGVIDKSANSLTSEDFKRLETLKSYSFAPAGTFGYSKAEITKGGVATNEIDSNTMMSKKVNGLYFIGEVLDVSGEVGGYNFQWAFSSSAICAKSILSYNKN